MARGVGGTPSFVSTPQKGRSSARFENPKRKKKTDTLSLSLTLYYHYTTITDYEAPTRPRVSTYQLPRAGAKSAPKPLACAARLSIENHN